MTDGPQRRLPADSDIDLHEPGQRAELRAHPWLVLSVISAGGSLGASARYLLGVAVPTPASGFPWTTLAINVGGCLLIGALMVLVTHVWVRRRLVRPFLGVGVLGGFTTFSTYIVEIQRLLDVGAAGRALAYLAGTLGAAIVATWVGLVVTRAVLRLALRRGAAFPVGR
ncbi:MAG TPA: CrcB family protein [Micromonosporaceae bacterium]|jgi:CrcB protein